MQPAYLLIIISFLIIQLANAQCPPNSGDDCGQLGIPDCSVTDPPPFCPECSDECPPGSQIKEDEKGTLVCIPVIEPVDPNDISGPTGYGEARWIAASEPMKYTIRFENDPELATASARNVSINYTFSDKVKQNSLILTNHGFNYFIYEIPGERPYYDSELDVRDSLGVLVALTAGVDVQRNQAFWRYRSLDPQTRQELRDVRAGFLPVNDSTGAGEGFVDFLVTPKEGSQTGDTIFAQASIVFDNNAPILTNQYFNVVDADQPSSAVDSVKVLSDTTFVVYTSASDPSSGIQNYDLFVSQNDGSYQLVGTSIHADSTFTVEGISDSTYCFVTLARDNVGNREDDTKIGKEDICEVLSPSITAIDPSIEERSIIVFPNPTSGSFKIRLDAFQAKPVSIMLVNTTGQTVFDQEYNMLNTYDVEININHLANGAYILNIVSDGKAVGKPKRIIKF
jgi:hypothetical protein